MNDLEFLEDERSAAQARGFTQHDTLSFMGETLSPLSIGTMSIMEQTGNRLIVGSQCPFFDAAAFVLLHRADERLAREARAAAWSGRVVWNEYVFAFMTSTPGIEAELMSSAPTFRRMIEDYFAILTKATGGETAKKKPGPLDGSRTSAASLLKKQAGASKRSFGKSRRRR